MDITLQEIKKEDTSVLFQLFQLFSYDTSEFSEKDVERDGCFHGYDVSEYTTSSNYISYFIKANEKLKVLKTRWFMHVMKIRQIKF